MLLTRWARNVERSDGSDERRVREYVDSPAGVSESASSLADKLGISQRRCRTILERLAAEGLVRRQDFADIEPMYLRFPTR
jgi:predicted ArsR family transcriptional regulator